MIAEQELLLPGRQLANTHSIHRREALQRRTECDRDAERDGRDALYPRFIRIAVINLILHALFVEKKFFCVWRRSPPEGRGSEIHIYCLRLYVRRSELQNNRDPSPTVGLGSRLF